MITEEEVAALAKVISEQVWRKVRNYIRRQQRELHDLEDDEGEDY